MARKRYKVGGRFGHAGAGRGFDIFIPILASDIIHAIKRAQMMGGLKKSYKDFWFAEEIGPREWMQTKIDWRRFKSMMRAREIEKKLKRKKCG